MLTVIDKECKNKNGGILWKCRCDCGQYTLVTTADLKNGHSARCKNHKATVRAGKRYGHLTAIEPTDERKQGSVVWKCVCDCGNVVYIRGNLLSQQIYCSKKCLLKEKTPSGITHGQSNTRLYRIWLAMKQRCYNKNNTRYENYGGRGITICAEWLNCFESFYQWAVKNGYSDELSIDRIDVNEGYTPNNCRWISNKEQQNNKRNNVFVEIDGETKTLQEWAEYTGINTRTIHNRYARGERGKDLIRPPKK